jgi:hypothetical protein
MKIWLDDWRDPPEGWIWTKTVEETISILENHYVDEISLDNDLGLDLQEGRKVVDYLEERLALKQVLPPRKIYAHTGNPAAKRYMDLVIKKIEAMVHALDGQVQQAGQRRDSNDEGTDQEGSESSE